MSKHTPGPWTVEGDDKTMIGADDGKMMLARAEYQHVVPAWCRSKVEAQANARLLASAPDLLAAAALAADTIDSLHDHYCPKCTGGCPDRETVEILRAAIRKATGGE
jgi:hypothetical protein